MFWYIEVLKKYADFSGRASRREYWWFVLFTTLASLILAVVDSALGTFNDQAGMGLLGGLYALLVLLPSIGVQIRRLHDVGRSGWWWGGPLVGGPLAAAGFSAYVITSGGLNGFSVWHWVFAITFLIWAIGGLIIFAFSLMKGVPGENRYGMNPLEINAATERNETALPARDLAPAKTPAVQRMRD